MMTQNQEAFRRGFGIKATDENIFNIYKILNLMQLVINSKIIKSEQELEKRNYYLF